MERGLVGFLVVGLFLILSVSFVSAGFFGDLWNSITEGEEVQLAPQSDFLSKTGRVGDIPVIGDWDGDGDSDIGAYNPILKKWYFDGNGDFKLTHVNGDKVYSSAGYEISYPLAGNWISSPQDEIHFDEVLYTRGNKWFYSLNPLNELVFREFGVYGVQGNVPLIGNWNDDEFLGFDEEMGVFRKAGNYGYFNLASDWDDDEGFLFGLATDQPFSGDFNGDGIDEIGTFRNVGGRGYVSLGRFNQFYFGLGSDILIVGNWDGDTENIWTNQVTGTDELGVFRIVEGEGVWLFDVDGNHKLEISGCTDNDEDGYFIGSSLEGGSCGEIDCRDRNEFIYPGNPTNGFCDCDLADGYSMGTPENTAGACTDGYDDDCNGLVDGNDPGCSVFQIGCTDNDEDGFSIEGGSCGVVDCKDNNILIYPNNPTNGFCDCDLTDGYNKGTPENTEGACSDGFDDDCDGLVDCEDDDCASTSACGVPIEPFCGDGICEGGETAGNCPEDCGEISNPCLEAGNICTSGIRGCGHYEQINLDCGSEHVTCCEEVPSCGDGVCFYHELPNYGENTTSCPEDCGEAVQECTETDEGKNYFRKGVTTKGVEVKEDYCSSPDQLDEFWCDGDTLRYTGYGCECLEGVCIIEEETCVDSDEGRDYSEKGFCFDSYDYELYGGEDNCYEEEGEIFLSEMYCEEIKCMRQNDIICPNGCEEGRCKEEPISTINECVDAGYICTSGIRGCGQYEQLDLSCNTDNNLIDCCEEVPYCGDGVCFYHNLPSYGENTTSCPEDCDVEPVGCENIGIRKLGDYCEESGNWILQKQENSFCENNFECEGNLCVDQACVDAGFLSSIIQWFKDLFG